MRYRSLVLLAVTLLVSHLACAQPSAPDTPEPGSGRGDRAGDHRAALPLAVGGVPARILERRVAARLPASHPRRRRASWSIPRPPTPTAGHSPRSSPRVRLFTIGRSEEGRDIMLLAIADEQGIRDLDRLKAATAALADPRRTDREAAERLIA